MEFANYQKKANLNEQNNKNANMIKENIKDINSTFISNKIPKNKLIGMSKLTDYDLYNQLGQGTFGIVTKAKKKSSNKLVALKKFIIKDKKDGFPITAFREITIMKKLKNINILQIIDMIYDSNNSIFFTVSPYISSDLNGLLNNPRINLNLSQIKCLFKQTLLGINYIHQSGYLHRDIKTANILLDHFGIIKIADFGLARLFHGKPPINSDSPPGGGKFDYTGLVVTRWYRPPELLLGDRKYTTAIDIWGIGCVFGELFLKKPILEGKSDIHQAEIIFQLLGSPTIENFPNCHLINRNNIDLQTNYSRTLELKFEKILFNDKSALNLLSGMLTLNPMKRFNAVKCLESDFFKKSPLPCETKELSNLEESHESDVKRFKDEFKSNHSHPVNGFSNNNTGNNSNLINHSIKNQVQNPNQHSINSLNHSKYGTDSSSYMNRTNSNLNIPNQMFDNNNNNNNNKNDFKNNFPRDRLPKRQIDQVYHNIQRSDNYYNNGRSYKYSSNYGQFDSYYNDEDYYDKRKKFKTDRFSSDDFNQTFSGGKELYGSSGAGDSSGLNALTKVLMKKKQDKNSNNNEN